MINHRAIHLAARSLALTLEAATTGSATLSATATGYARASGSFLTDGFSPGMEVTPTGFTQTAVGTIQSVTATTMTIKDGRTVQSAGAARTLAVGLPSARAWENVILDPVADEPYIVESYLPGALTKVTAGAFGELEATPLYVVQFLAPQHTGFSALARYADALLVLFAPGTPMTVGSDVARVRTDLAPYPSPLQQTEDGWAVVTVTIPLKLRTANSR